MMYILRSRNEDAVISGIKYGRLKLERENVRAILSFWSIMERERKGEKK